MKICLTTACSPWLPLEQLIPILAQSGYDGVEVAYTQRRWDPEQPPNCWNNNAAVIDRTAPVSEQLAAAAGLKALATEHGMVIPCLGSYVLSSELEDLEQALAVAQACGASSMRVRVPWYPDGSQGASYNETLAATRSAYAWLSEQGRKIGVRSLIELHNNSICPTASAAMRVLEGLDPASVGVILDPGNYAHEGLERLPMVIDLLGPYLQHVHVKNATLAVSEATNPLGVKVDVQFCPLHEGIVDWPLLLQQLADNGYQGWLSVENFADVERGPARLADDAEQLRRCLP
jgi:sugar phosphate isomerase/epimerase